MLNQGAHIFVTGGTGFIGTPLCLDLHNRGYRVSILTREPDRHRSRFPGEIVLVGAIEDLDSVGPVDAVINLAGAPLADRRWSAKRKEQFYRSRVGLTEQLYEHFADGRQPPSVLISGSAIGYYGPHGDETLTEDGASNNSFSSELCRAWESMACQFESLGSRVCRIRTGIVLGDGGALKAMLLPFRLGLGGPMGGGEQWMSWIHLEDMVGLIGFCLNSEHIEGPVNATAPQPVTNREFSKTLANTLSRPCLLPMPAFAARLMFGEMAEELLLSGQKVVPAKLEKAAYDFKYPVLNEALAAVLQRS